MNFVQSYKYDSLYRLKEAKETSGANQNWVQNWDYDRYGNRIAFTQNIAGNTSATNPTIDPTTNRFNTGQNFGYDANGNVVSDVDPLSSLPRQFIFNGDNKQTEVKKDGITVGRYFYDGEGKRVKKVTDAETTVFVYSAGKLIAEYSTQLSQSPSIAYTTTDHLGTPRVITDQFGQVKARRDFMPYGEEIAPDGTRRTFRVSEKHLSGVENALGVEDVFDSLHYFERRRINGVMHVVGFYVADAVFAGDGAAEVDRKLKGFGDALAGSGDLFGVVAVNDEIDVDVAVAGVAEIGDEGVVLFADLLDAGDELRHL